MRNEVAQGAIWASAIVTIIALFTVAGITASNNSKVKEQACLNTGKSIVFRTLEETNISVKECK